MMKLYSRIHEILHNWFILHFSVASSNSHTRTLYTGFPLNMIIIWNYYVHFNKIQLVYIYTQSRYMELSTCKLIDAAVRVFNTTISPNHQNNVAIPQNRIEFPLLENDIELIKLKFEFSFLKPLFLVWIWYMSLGWIIINLGKMIKFSIL